MAEITITELTFEWDKESLEQALKELELYFTKVILGISIELWKAILKGTPQYTGAMTASWSWSVNTPVFVNRSDLVPDTYEDSFYVRAAGNPEAIEIADSVAQFQVGQYKLGDTIYFANGVIGESGAPYSGEVEGGAAIGKYALRSRHRPASHAKRAVDKISVRYVDVSSLAANRLFKKTL